MDHAHFWQKHRVDQISCVNLKDVLFLWLSKKQPSCQYTLEYPLAWKPFFKSILPASFVVLVSVEIESLRSNLCHNLFTTEDILRIWKMKCWHSLRYSPVGENSLLPPVFIKQKLKYGSIGNFFLYYHGHVSLDNEIIIIASEEAIVWWNMSGFLHMKLKPSNVLKWNGNSEVDFH